MDAGRSMRAMETMPAASLIRAATVNHVTAIVGEMSASG